MKTSFVIALILATLSCASAENSVSLGGSWRFELDRAGVGISERWFDRALSNQIVLPGSLPTQGVGDDITINTPWIGGILDRSWYTKPEYAKHRQPPNVKVPFWLQPEKYYRGAAWYQRDFEIANGWQGKRIVLSLERPHWQTSVWLDGHFIGANDSLSTLHEYDFGQLAPGKHTLTIRVDNDLVIDIGENSHCISDHTQGNWNGIVGDIGLRAEPLVWINDLRVYPHTKTKSATVRGTIGNASGQSGSGEIRFALGGKILQRLTANWNDDGGSFETKVDLGDAAQTWDEFHPNVQHLTATLAGTPYEVNFGLREISTQGTQFTVNERKLFFRGTLDCCIFPLTGHPPMDVESWKREIRIAKSFGLNLIRFHSWCPPEAAFQAADELGFYLQVENCWSAVGNGKPVDKWVYRETDRIVRAYGNHPSFALMTYGNEPTGANANSWLSKWVNHWKDADSRRLYTSGSGWPQLPENQFHVTPDPRIQHGEGLQSRINARPPETTTDYRDYIQQRAVPVISHEIGEWCVYPNFDEIPKYTGSLKPKNFEIFRDLLVENGLGSLAKEFLFASGKLQTMCYKEEIESALRTPGMGGFQLLDLHDFPGQGTALVGVLDPFWGEKGYVTAKEFRRFCDTIVPLARLQKRVFRTDEIFSAAIEAANFSSGPIENAVPEWRLVGDDGKIYARGKLPAKTLSVDNGIALGEISTSLKNVQAPARLKLVVGLTGTKFENDWDIWVYPVSQSKTPADVLVTTVFDAAAQTALASGGKVLLTIPGDEVRNFDAAQVKLGFSSIFWNTAWSGRQAPTTLGILCDPQTPALAGFPTDSYSNWQWWYLIHRAGALRLDVLPENVAPIVRVIDDWFTARPLALILEGRCGAGKIVICGFDLTDGALTDPVSRQVRTSLVDYLDSQKCQPSVELSGDQIRYLTSDKMRAVAVIKASAECDGYEARHVIDGDPQTLWHTPWTSVSPSFPHELVVEFTAPEKITGFTALPRQDGIRNGWIKEYAFYVSSDGVNWGEAVVKGVFPGNDNLKTIHFPSAVGAHFVKLVALSGYADGPWASLAELNVIRVGR